MVTSWEYRPYNDLVLGVDIKHIGVDPKNYNQIWSFLHTNGLFDKVSIINIHTLKPINKNSFLPSFATFENLIFATAATATATAAAASVATTDTTAVMGLYAAASAYYDDTNGKIRKNLL